MPSVCQVARACPLCPSYLRELGTVRDDKKPFILTPLWGSQFIPKPGNAAFVPVSWTIGKVGHLLFSLVTLGSGFFGGELLIDALPQLTGLSALCMCAQVHVEARHQPQVSSSGAVLLFYESGSLADLEFIDLITLSSQTVSIHLLLSVGVVSEVSDHAHVLGTLPTNLSLQL